MNWDEVEGQRKRLPAGRTSGRETHWERLESDSREEGSVVGRIQER